MGGFVPQDHHDSTEEREAQKRPSCPVWRDQGCIGSPDRILCVQSRGREDEPDQHLVQGEGYGEQGEVNSSGDSARTPGNRGNVDGASWVFDYRVALSLWVECLGDRSVLHPGERSQCDARHERERAISPVTGGETASIPRMGGSCVRDFSL